MLHVVGFGGIGDVLALLILGFAAHELPIVGDGEDGVSILEGSFEGVDVVEICLRGSQWLLGLTIGWSSARMHG